MSLAADGHPDKVRCRECGEVWQYYTSGELYRRPVERRKERNRRYYWEHREKMLEYGRERYKKYGRSYTPAPEHDYKDCAMCGAPFYPYHFYDRYCTMECANEAEYQRRKERRREIAKLRKALVDAIGEQEVRKILGGKTDPVRLRLAREKVEELGLSL